MIRSIVAPTALTLILLQALSLAGCAATTRSDGSDGSDSRPASWDIFRPLNLPTPNSIRTAAGTPGPDYWQQQVDYVIEATLDADNRRLEGRATITYTNNSPDPLDYLWLHLEQNIFRPHSDGAKTTPPGARFAPREPEGGYDIHYLGIGDRALDYSVYDTVARVEMPETIEPRGGTVDFEIAWSFRIPGYGIDRHGIEEVEEGTIFQLAQWFPAVAVYDDVRGWNTLPYIGLGEFYTNFGNYDVTITAPRSHIVVATGVLMNPSEVLTAEQIARLDEARESETPVFIRSEEEVGDPFSRPAGFGPLTWHFRAEDVRTVAWASSEAFIWDAAGIDWGPALAEAGNGSGVLVQSVYPKEALPLWAEISTDALRFSILHYSERWYRYPYPTAINVNGTVGGMEYPMIIFCRNRTSADGLFGVTTHEIGHNWFPMIVNTDERRYMWFDEGLNSFINHYAWQEWNARQERRAPGVSEDESQPAAAPADPQRAARDRRRRAARPGQPYSAAWLAERLADGNLQPTDLPADQLRPGDFGFLQYRKPAAALSILREHILGEERFDRAFRRYIEQWAFKSPQPADFFRCIEDAAGMDLAWFWRSWFLEHTTLDQAIESVEQDDSLDEVTITLANHGEMVLPVNLRLDFADGSTLNWSLPVQVWYSAHEWVTAIPTHGRRVTAVTVDPDELWPDGDRSNNVWSR